jgi:type III pantothenate kinase
MILCDIGNTTFHFLIKSQHTKYFHNEKLPNISAKIYFISVNTIATKKFIKKYPNAIDLSKNINFKTKYKGIGIDRVVALIKYKNAIIVDAGSAITVDIINKGKHKGGFILVGINSLKNIYPNISKKLNFKFNKKININKIPLNTNDAINYSIIKSIILPIKDIAKNKNIIFTGGDGKFLSKFINGSKYDKNIIFDGMKLLIKD